MLEYQEVLRQEYSQNKCVFSAGFVSGHEVDTMYIRLERDGEEPTVLLFRPDEMACVAWLASGVLWSNEMRLLTLIRPLIVETGNKCPRCNDKGYFLIGADECRCMLCNPPSGGGEMMENKQLKPFRVAKNDEAGDNWPICWTGCDEQGNEFNVTTDHVHGSEVHHFSRGAEGDAILISQLLNWYYGDLKRAKEIIAEDK